MQGVIFNPLNLSVVGQSVRKYERNIRIYNNTTINIKLKVRYVVT